MSMLTRIVIISLCVIAVYATMLYGMIFGFIRKYFEDKFPNSNWLHKPIFDCPICMTPYYGTIFYWGIFGIGIKDWLVVIIAAMGLVTWFVKSQVRN